MADYTSTALIDRVKRYAAIPAHQPAFPDLDIREFLTECLQTDLAPFLISQMGEYLVHYEDITPPAQVGGYVMLPSRCWAGAVREICVVDANGNFIRDLKKRNIDDINFYNTLNDSDTYNIQSNKLFCPSISGQFIRVYYFARPGAIVQTADVGTITAIDETTKTITVNAIPGAWGVTTTFDIVQGKPQFSLMGIDLGGTIISNTVVFTDDLPTGIEVGDYVCATGESPVAQIPLESQNMLCQMTAGKIMESLGDIGAMNIAYQKAEVMKQNLLTAMTPRNQGNGNFIQTSGGFL